MPLDGDQHTSVPESLTRFTQSLKDLENPSTGHTKQWDGQHQQLIQGRLQQHLGPEFISTRPAPGGNRVSYLEGWRAIQLANDTFGFNGWSSEVKEINIDFCDQVKDAYCVGVSATIRVTLKDGTFHEDVGFGHIENSRSKAMAFDKCRKEATTDGLKRALRKFGNALGNSLYNKNLLNQTKNLKKKQFNVDMDNLIREADFGGGIVAYNIERQVNASSHQKLLAMRHSVTLPTPRCSAPQIHNEPPMLKQEPCNVETNFESEAQNGIGHKNAAPTDAFKPTEKDKRPLVGPDAQYSDDVEDLDEYCVGKNQQIYPPDELQFSDDTELQFDDFFEEHHDTNEHSLNTKLINASDNGYKNKSLHTKPVTDQTLSSGNHLKSRPTAFVQPQEYKPALPRHSRPSEQIERTTAVASDTIPKNVCFHRLTVDYDVTKDTTEHAPAYNPQDYPRKGRTTIDDRSVPIIADKPFQDITNHPPRHVPHSHIKQEYPPNDHAMSQTGTSPALQNPPAIVGKALPNRLSVHRNRTPAKSPSPSMVSAGSPARQFGAPKSVWNSAPAHENGSANYKRRKFSG